MVRLNRLLAPVLAGLLALPLVAPAAAQPAPAAVQLYLRRGAFDPLDARPAAAPGLRASPSSTLALVQFDSVPTPAARAALESAGMRPLAYIPDNTLLVRRPARAYATSLAGVRWSGPLHPADKLAPDLERLALAPDASAPELRLLLAPDADPAAFARDLAALGGVILGQAGGAGGAIARVRLPAAALAQLLRHDSVLWAERFNQPRLANDRAQAIAGVAAARQRFGWLDGSGQIIAVTDTGLDVQAQVQAGANPDFLPARIAAAYSPAQMNPGSSACRGVADWSDRLGHGTHVAGSAVGAGARAPAGQGLGGAAPAARLVVQAVTLGGAELDCLPGDASFLAQAYAAGARVQNASWGGPTGGTNTSPEYGGYDLLARQVDEFLWNHKDHLLLVAAGNEGADRLPRDGVIDPDSINSPGSAKNVLTVGASENNRPPTGGCSTVVPENMCWSFGYAEPITYDFISNNPAGMAAFSSRGPADDGRLKPEIVAPGTNIISAASHHASAHYTQGNLNADYAYDTGTSMATPLASGMAALARQWLARERGVVGPSAALLKALLLNGATNIGPGQYGRGVFQEIPGAWPNTVAGWGRANLFDALGAGQDAGVWFDDNSTGLTATGASNTYALLVRAGQPLRLTLAWTDYPASPNSGRALVNDLDLEVVTPAGVVLRGNMLAQIGDACRDSASGADRCNPAESVAIAAPDAGLYRVTVRGAKLPFPAQPYALVARASYVDPRPPTPALRLAGPAGPVVRLSWGAVFEGAVYQVEESPTSSFMTITARAQTSALGLALVAEPGTHWYRVRACVAGLCSAPSSARSALVTQTPLKRWLPLLRFSAKKE